MSRANVMLLLFSLFIGAQHSRAEVSIADRHVIMIQTGVEVIWGHYLFAIHNDTRKAAPFSSQVLLPNEMSDFQPQEGLTSEEVKLSPESGVVVQTQVPPETKLVGLAFKVDTNQTSSDLSFVAPYAIKDLRLLVPVNSISISGDGIESGGEVDLQGRKMNSFSLKDIEKGEKFTITVSGMVSSRRPYYFLAALVVGLIGATASFLTFRTRIKKA